MTSFENVFYFEKIFNENSKKIMLYSFNDNGSVKREEIEFNRQTQTMILTSMFKIEKIVERKDNLYIYFFNGKVTVLKNTPETMRNITWIKDYQTGYDTSLPIKKGTSISSEEKEEVSVPSEEIKKIQDSSEEQKRINIFSLNNKIRKAIVFVTIVAGIGYGVSKINCGTSIINYIAGFLSNDTKISQDNDYNGQTTTIKDDKFINVTHEQAIEIIMGSIYQNSNFKENNIKILQYLRDFFTDNPYIEYNKVYETLKTVIVDTVEHSSITGRAGGYWDIYNKIDMSSDYEKSEPVFFHEIIHSLGWAGMGKIDEGLAELLTAEYYEKPTLEGKYDKSKHYNSYLLEQKVATIFLEMIGKDVILEGFSTRNIDPIISAISKVYGSKEDATNLINYLWSLLDKNNKDDNNKEEELEVCKLIVTALTPYYNAMPEGNNKTIVSIYFKQLQNETNISVIKNYFNKRNDSKIPPVLIVKNVESYSKDNNFFKCEATSDECSPGIYSQPLLEDTPIDPNIFAVDSDIINQKGYHQ